MERRGPAQAQPGPTTRHEPTKRPQALSDDAPRRAPDAELLGQRKPQSFMGRHLKDYGISKPPPSPRPAEVNAELRRSIAQIEWNPDSYDRLSSELRTNPLVALTYVRVKGKHALRNLPPALLRDPDFVYACMKEGHTKEILQRMDPALWNNRAFILKAVGAGPTVFGHPKMPAHFKTDRAIALLAVECDEKSWKYLPLHLRKDATFRRTAFQKNPLLLKILGLSDDRTSALSAVSRSWVAFDQVSPQLRNDPMIARRAMATNLGALLFLGPRLARNGQFLLTVFHPGNRNLLAEDIALFEHIRPSLRPHIWRDLVTRLHRQGHPMPRKHMHSYSAFKRHLRSSGITLKRFWSLTVALHVLHTRNNMERLSRDKEIAIVFTGTADHNGAFERNGSHTADLVKNGRFHVIYVEGRRDNGLPKILAEVHRRTGRKVHTLFVGGHGSEQSLALSAGDRRIKKINDPEEREIDPSDFHDQEFRRLARFIKPDGQVLLNSCSNGAGGHYHDNLANMWAELLPKRRIYSNRMAGSIGQLDFNKDLSLRVSWIGRGYTVRTLEQPLGSSKAQKIPPVAPPRTEKILEVSP